MRADEAGDKFWHAQCGVSQDDERHVARAALREPRLSDHQRQTFLAPLDYRVLHEYVVVRAQPSRASAEFGRRTRGDVVSIAGQRLGWMMLAGSEGGWMLLDASALGLGVLMAREVVALDGPRRLRAGGTTVAWADPTRAAHRDGDDDHEVVRRFAPGEGVSIVATCGGFGKCWVDMPALRACSASIRAAWVLLDHFKPPPPPPPPAPERPRTPETADEGGVDTLPDELLNACFAALSAVSLGRVGRASTRWRSVSSSLLAAHKFVRIATIVDKLEHIDSDSRQKAVQALSAVDAQSLASHAGAIVVKLEHENRDVRRAAVDTLEAVDIASLAMNASAIAAMLDDDDDAYLRQAALQLLGKLDAASLASHAAAIAARLEDPAPGVRRAAVVALGNLDLTSFAMHATTVRSRLDDIVPYVRHAVMQTLSSLSL